MKIKNKTIIILLLIVLAAVSAAVFYYIHKDKITYRYNSYIAHHHNYEVYGGMTDELKLLRGVSSMWRRYSSESERWTRDMSPPHSA